MSQFEAEVQWEYLLTAKNTKFSHTLHARVIDSFSSWAWPSVDHFWGLLQISQTHWYHLKALAGWMLWTLFSHLSLMFEQNDREVAVSIIVRTENICLHIQLIKTVVRVFIAASNYSHLWLWIQLLLGFLDCSLGPISRGIAFKLAKTINITISHEDVEGLVIDWIIRASYDSLTGYWCVVYICTK